VLPSPRPTACRSWSHIGSPASRAVTGELPGLDHPSSDRFRHPAFCPACSTSAGPIVCVALEVAEVAGELHLDRVDRRFPVAVDRRLARASCARRRSRSRRRRTPPACRIRARARSAMLSLATDQGWNVVRHTRCFPSATKMAAIPHGGQVIDSASCPCCSRPSTEERDADTASALPSLGASAVPQISGGPPPTCRWAPSMPLYYRRCASSAFAVALPRRASVRPSFRDVHALASRA